MRKNVILMGILGLALLISLIIFNLFHSDVSPKKTLPVTNTKVSDIATPLDTAWFNTPEAVVIPKQRSLLPVQSIQPAAVKEDSADIESAPINSNQIRVEFEKKDLNVKSINPPFPQDPVNAYEIQAGTIIPAILISGINSDLEGQIIGQVRENVYDSISGRYLLIPQGAKLLGNYNAKIIYGQQRVMVAWQRLIFPNGKSLDLNDIPGVDVSGYAGFKDLVDNHFSKIFSSVLLMSIIGAGLQLSQPQQSAANNSSYPSVNQTLAQNVGINLSQTALQVLQKNLNIQPTLEIRPGYLFNVNVVKDLILEGPFN